MLYFAFVIRIILLTEWIISWDKVLWVLLARGVHYIISAALFGSRFHYFLSVLVGQIDDLRGGLIDDRKGLFAGNSINLDVFFKVLLLAT